MNEETAAVRVMIIMRMMMRALSVWQHIGKQKLTNFTELGDQYYIESTW